MAVIRLVQRSPQEQQMVNLHRLRFGSLVPPKRGPFAAPKRVAGIPSRVTTSAGSRSTAASREASAWPCTIALTRLASRRPRSKAVLAAEWRR